MLKSQTTIVVVTPLSIFLSCLEQLFGFSRISLHYRSITHLALEEVFEVVPVRLFTVERKRILTLFLEFGIISPKMPVSTFYSCSFFSLGTRIPMNTSAARIRDIQLTLKVWVSVPPTRMKMDRATDRPAEVIRAVEAGRRP